MKSRSLYQAKLHYWIALFRYIGAKGVFKMTDPTIPPRVAAAWAAYVLGHDMGWLIRWHWSTWGIRREAQANKVSLSMELPSATIDLDCAASTFASLKYLSTEDAYVFGRCLERWCHEMDMMLIECTYPETTALFEDWKDHLPSPASYLGLSRIATVLRDNSEWLRQWYDVGEWMASQGEGFPWIPEKAERELALFSKLTSELGIPELSTLASFLAAFSQDRNRTVPQSIESIVDPVRNVPSTSRIEAFVRQTLKGGRAPELWVSLTPEVIHFLGMELSPSQLQKRERVMLWRLCETPFTRVTREQIIQATEEPTSRYLPKRVATTASRLRSVLQPAVDAFVRRQRWNDEAVKEARAHKCFIVDIPRSDKKLSYYQLFINPAHVRIVGRRPKGMKPLAPNRDEG
jgi:hypothetical protein